MTNFFKSFVRDESGASAAEYALILAVVGGAVIAGALALGNAVATELNETASVIVQY